MLSHLRIQRKKTHPAPSRFFLASVLSASPPATPTRNHPLRASIRRAVSSRTAVSRRGERGAPCGAQTFFTTACPASKVLVSSGNTGYGRNFRLVLPRPTSQSKSLSVRPHLPSQTTPKNLALDRVLWVEEVSQWAADLKDDRLGWSHPSNLLNMVIVTASLQAFILLQGVLYGVDYFLRVMSSQPVLSAAISNKKCVAPSTSGLCFDDSQLSSSRVVRRRMRFDPAVTTNKSKTPYKRRPKCPLLESTSDFPNDFKSSSSRCTRSSQLQMPIEYQTADSFTSSEAWQELRSDDQRPQASLINPATGPGIRRWVGNI
ncbi:hypothetical protein EJB05_01892, partial [Eragrostis curvula]